MSENGMSARLMRPARQPISNTQIAQRIELLIELRKQCPAALRDNLDKRIVGAEQGLQWVLGKASALPQWITRRAEAIRAMHGTDCVCAICRKAYRE